jgi:hypothetical protein
MRIERHPTDAAFARRHFEESIADLPEFLVYTRRNPNNLSLLS